MFGSVFSPMLIYEGRKDKFFSIWSVRDCDDNFWSFAVFVARNKGCKIM